MGMFTAAVRAFLQLDGSSQYTQLSLVVVVVTFSSHAREDLGKGSSCHWWWLWSLFPHMGGRIWGEVQQFIPHLRFLFFKWRSACAHQIHPLSLDQSTVAQ